MRRTHGIWAGTGFLLLVFIGVDHGAVADAPQPTMEVHVVVSGDVDACLVDSEGRRTGWLKGERVTDIPGCGYSGDIEGEAEDASRDEGIVVDESDKDRAGIEPEPKSGAARADSADTLAVPPTIHEFTFYNQLAASYRLLVASRDTGSVDITVRTSMRGGGCSAQDGGKFAAGKDSEWEVGWRMLVHGCNATIKKIEPKRSPKGRTHR